MDIYSLILPLLRKIDAETAHNLAIHALSSGMVPPARKRNYPQLSQKLWGLHFANPVGLAPGFDKNAQAWNATLKQGFGFIELGTVTPQPQQGNAKPRMFRLEEDSAVINRYGFNNIGMHGFAENLSGRPRDAVIGINIGKNKDADDAIADYLMLLAGLYNLADYITVNISSPNTVGLRALQEKGVLKELVTVLLDRRNLLTGQTGRRVPVLVKIAPDLTDSDKADICAVALETGVDGLIVSNTTIERPLSLISQNKAEKGGLSGKPLFEASTAVLKEIHRGTKGEIPLVGVGGIASGEDAYQKILAGASLVQLYTALAYQGFSLIARINSYLEKRMAQDGFRHISDVVGKGN